VVCGLGEIVGILTRVAEAVSRARVARASRSRGRVVAGVAIFSVVLGTSIGASIATAPSASAADIASFNAGNLISNAVFYDGGATKAGTIQTLLNAQGSRCVAAGTLKCLKDIAVSIPKSSSDKYCAAIAAHAGQSAATVFATIGAACSINPAVLVVLVQKEQSLVTRSSPTTSSYEKATGYNCPDTAPCNTATAGFYRQVYGAARQFQVYRQNPTGYNFQSGRYNTIRYSTAASCGSSSVYIENSATAGLYDYTPYQPDKAAIANVTGSGDACSSYGNRNFWRYFNDWFGNSGNLLKSASFEGSVTGWAFGTTVARSLMAATTSSPAQAGQYYLAANTTTGGASISQTVAKTLTPGGTYSGSIWLRSTSSVPFTGKLVVWGLGGSAEAGITTFSVGSTWTQITANLVPQKSGHTQLRLQLYLSTTHSTVDLDSANLAAMPSQPARGPVTISSPSFEQGIGGWTFKNGFMNRAVYNIPAQAEDGTRFLAANTQVAGRSVGLDVARVPVVGDTYTTTVWMKSGKGTLPFTGKLVLWALGGTTEQSATSFTVGPTWSPVEVNLPIAKSGHTRLRIEIYLGTTKYDLDLDNASLTGNLISNGSFESGVANLTASNGTATITSVPATPTTTGLIAGTKWAEFTVPTSGYSVALGVDRTLTAGETYTATLWMRTADPTKTFSGKLALWATGGVSQNATKTVTGITGTWTPVTVALKIADANNDHLKVELYSTAPSVELLLDGVVLQ
jgi:Carbohydrate binding domain